MKKQSVGIAPKGLRARGVTSISIDGEVHEKGKRLAEKEGRTFSYWVERLIQREVESLANRKASRKA